MFYVTIKMGCLITQALALIELSFYETNQLTSGSPVLIKKKDWHSSNFVDNRGGLSQIN